MSRRAAGVNPAAPVERALIARADPYRAARMFRLDGLNALVLVAILLAAPGCVSTFDAALDRVKSAPELEPFDDSVLREAQPAPLAFEVSEPDGEPRGLAIWLDGIDDPDDADDLFDELEDAGFAIARARVPAILATPLELRIGGAMDVEGVAKRVSSAVDADLARNVIAVTRFVQDLPRSHKKLAMLPRVLVGFSTGGAVLPAVAGRIDRVAAAILVSTPSNLLQLARRSERSDLGLSVTVAEGGLTDKQSAWLSDLYLADSQLDPYRTAQFLWRVPVLMYHARFDAVIPTDLCEELHIRLRRPDTLRVLGKHGFFEWHADFDADEIRAWLDRELARDARSPARR